VFSQFAHFAPSLRTQVKHQHSTASQSYTLRKSAFLFDKHPKSDSQIHFSSQHIAFLHNLIEGIPQTTDLAPFTWEIKKLAAARALTGCEPYLGVDDLAEAAECFLELALVGLPRQAAHEDPALLLPRHCRLLIDRCVRLA
jgi:hypothetical protein